MLSYTLFGRLENPLLIFLHGFLGVKEDWEEVIPQLIDHFCCIILDLPGHGSSSLEKDALQQINQWFLDFLSSNLNNSNSSSKKPTLIGYSMGGRIALTLYKDNSLLFSKVIAISTHFGLQDPIERDKRKKSDLRWAQKLLENNLKEFLQQWYAQPIFTSLRENRSLFEKIKKRRLSRQNSIQLSEVLRQFSLANQPIITPVNKAFHLIYGEKDLKFATLYHTLSKQANVYKIPNAGHALHLEQPIDCSLMIKKILEGVAQ